MKVEGKCEIWLVDGDKGTQQQRGMRDVPHTSNKHHSEGTPQLTTSSRTK
jgi:hypothetical protein